MITCSPAAPKAVTLLLNPAPENREELLQALRSLRVEIERGPGCLACVVCRDIEGGNQVVFLSQWETEADLARHLASEHFRVLSGASRLLGTSAGSPFVPPLPPSPSLASP